ncbi:MAG TPA: peptide deformylase [Candidatus Saccharimonadales bacterium]|nr:peptide deformylase [Candidatus Saccharimonadales bacterium]
MVPPFGWLVPEDRMAILLIHNFKQPHKGILQEPHPTLRAVSKPVKRINDQERAIAGRLLKVLQQVDKPWLRWLGMAAPQLGFNTRIIAIKRATSKYQIMINPEIVAHKLLLPSVAGCYSLKGLYLVRRYYWLKVKYHDLDNKEHVEVFWGGKAGVLQQEIEHLDGKLICD